MSHADWCLHCGHHYTRHSITDAFCTERCEGEHIAELNRNRPGAAVNPPPSVSREPCTHWYRESRHIDLPTCQCWVCQGERKEPSRHGQYYRKPKRNGFMDRYEFDIRRRRTSRQPQRYGPQRIRETGKPNPIQQKVNIAVRYLRPNG